MEGQIFHSSDLLLHQAIRPQILEGARGPGLIFRGTSIHQSEDPYGEARLWAGEAIARRKDRTVPELALIFGLGLGWHLRAIREMFPDIKIAVLEPDQSLMDTFEKYNVLLKNEKFDLFTDMAQFSEMLSREIVYSQGGQPVIISLPGYRNLWGEMAQSFEGRIAEECSRRAVIDKTRVATSSVYLENVAKNTRYATILPDAMLLKGCLPPRPAFLVGAGPSLDQNGELLKKIGQNGLIICAGAALKPLLHLGVSPQVVLILESSDTSSYIQLNAEEKEILGPSCVLALASGAHPNHFLVEGFHKCLFHLSGGEAQLLGQGFFLPQGGNAGTAAFALAYVWGLAPLILVGQDQAYQGQGLHAAFTPDNVTEVDRGQVINVPGIGGTTVETNTGLMASINWYAEAAATIVKKAKFPKLINATHSGASIPGFEEIPLNLLIEAMLNLPEQLKLPEALLKLPKPTTKELHKDLKQMSAILNTLRRLVHTNYQSAIAEMMHVSGISAFMGQMLAPTLAAGHKMGVLKNLDWADGIILKMMHSLDS